MRVSVRIGKDTVLALKELEKILPRSSDEKMTNGDILTYSWKLISTEVDSIDWLKVADLDIFSIVTSQEDVTGVNTTMNIDDDVEASLNDFKFSLTREFGQFIYFPYVVKLVLFGAILIKRNKLSEYKK
ncbi:MAG: hypothetical protein WA887_02375 [Carnobacterium jeotgali]|uniref:hypothetical protein n=1 Tax=Carnobacterium jeotgali TaxID=545534 RepID=UPI003C73A6CA